MDTSVLNGYSDEGGSRSERSLVKTHVTGIVWKEPQPGALHSGDPDALCITCAHTPGDHGIGTRVQPGTDCSAETMQPSGYMGKCPCAAYSPAVQPVGTVAQ